MVKNRINIKRAEKMEIPLFYEIKEKKAKLTIKVYEKNVQKFQLSADDIYKWLTEEDGSMRYPLGDRNYDLYHRNHKVWFACNMDAESEVEYSIEWNDMPVIVSAAGNPSGERTYKMREEIQVEAVSVKSERETELEDLLSEQQLENRFLQDMVDNNLYQHFHESGAYVQKLKENEDKLKDGAGKAAFEAWQERKSKLDEKERELLNKLNQIEIERKEKEGKVKGLEKTHKEAEQSLKQLEKLNEETLKQLEENKERLKMDQEVLSFIANNHIDIEGTLKNVEETLKKTEQMVREAIVLKEKKIDMIEKSVRGDNGESN